jgi:hypothetical protein
MGFHKLIADIPELIERLKLLSYLGQQMGCSLVKKLRADIPELIERLSN